MKLSGKVALVTGSARGIGAATVRALAKEGAKVVINYVKAESRARQTLQEIESSNGHGMVVQADVSNKHDVSRMVAECNKTFGKVDILVNNAAGPPIYNPFLQTTWEDFIKQIDVMLKGAYLCCKAVIPGMIERKWGRIINIGGSALAQPFLKIYGYWIAKAGLLALSRTMALELGQYDITVNSVLPGLIKTEIHESWGPPETGGKQTPQQWQRIIDEKQAVKRMGQPEDVASAIVYLCSDEASFITGQALHISGGMVTSPV